MKFATSQRDSRAVGPIELSTDHEPEHEAVSMGLRHAASGHCLVIDHALPTPDHDSGSRRMAELLTILADLGFAITFVPQDGVDLPSYRESLTAGGIAVLSGPADLDDYLQRAGADLRLVVLSRPTVAWANYPLVRSLAPDAVLVYDTVDLHFVRERRRAVTLGEHGAAAKSAEYHYGMEMGLIGLADQVWVVSAPEAELLRTGDPSLDVAVVPNVHREAPAGPPFEAREGILFVGNYGHDPNRDAARWLVEEIMPLVRGQLGPVPLVLAGSRVTPEIEALAGEGVSVPGWIPDLEPLYHRSRLFVAPLRFGAGMKGKVGEACAFGLPVVTTSVGAEGMTLVMNRDLLVADDAQSFATAVINAYSDPSLWGKLAEGARRAIIQQLSPAAVRAGLARTLSGLGLSVTEPI